MLKKLMMALSLCAILVAPASAQGTFTFGLNGFGDFPMGDFSDAAATGFGGGVFADYWVTPQFAIGADLGYNRFGGNEDLENALSVLAGTEVDVTWTFIDFGLHGKYAFAMEGSSMAPWLGVGLAGYNISGEADPGGDIGDSETKFGFNVGLGLDWKASSAMSFGVFGKYHNIMDAMVDETGDETSASYIQAGVNLTFSTTGTVE